MSALVAVTGGTGFIGLHLANALCRRGYRLRLLVRRLPVHPLLAPHRFEAVPGHLNDPAALQRLVAGADAVVHLAGAIKGAGKRDLYAANADGSEALARVVRQSGLARFVCVSSLAAREPLLSHYAASKREGEERVRRLAGDLPWTILRPAAVYGPWDRETLPIFKLTKLGLTPILGAAESRLGFIHVDDLVAAILLALDGAGAGGVHELDDGRQGGYAWPEIIATAGRALGRQPRSFRIAPGLLKLYGAACTGLSHLTGRPIILANGKVNEILHPDWCSAWQGLTESRGWRAKYNLDSGFADAAGWYRNAGWL